MCLMEELAGVGGEANFGGNGLGHFLFLLAADLEHTKCAAFKGREPGTGCPQVSRGQF